MATPHTITPACPLELTMENPHRPPDWRWRRARFRVETKSRRQLRQDDDWTGRAKRFLRLATRDEAKAFRSDPELGAAWHFSTSGGLKRAEVEARVLARQSPDEIAVACRLGTSVIKLYETLCFAVRDRLNAQSWVQHNVLGPKTWEPLQRDGVGWTWKAFGYAYGPVAIDELINAVAHSELLQFGLDAYLLPHSTLDLGLKFLISARRLPLVEEMSAAERCFLSRLSPRLVESKPRIRWAEVSWAPNWDQMLDSLPPGTTNVTVPFNLPLKWAA